MYVFVKEKERWKYGEWKQITLKSVRATEKTVASVLGQNDKVLEYRPEVVPQTTWKQDEAGLHVRAMRAQRLYNDRKWPNPVVLKLTNVKPALQPPQVRTLPPRWNAAAQTLVLEAELRDLGKAASVEAGFEYRDITGQDASERTEPWKPAGLARRISPGRFSGELKGLRPGSRYEVRAVVKHPLLTVYGEEHRADLR